LAVGEGHVYTRLHSGEIVLPFLALERCACQFLVQNIYSVLRHDFKELLKIIRANLVAKTARAAVSCHKTICHKVMIAVGNREIIDFLVEVRHFPFAFYLIPYYGCKREELVAFHQVVKKKIFRLPILIGGNRYKYR